MDNATDYKKGIRQKVIIMAFFLSIIIMSFTGLLNYMTFADNYNNSLINTYSVAGNELVRKIEYALFYGKPINNYYGMNDTLKELKEVIPEVEQLNITSPSGDILYDLNGFVQDSQLEDEKLLKTAGFEQGVVTENISYQFYQKKAHVFIRINDSSAQHIANLLMIFPPESFLQFNSYLTKQLLTYLLIIAITALIALFIIFFRIKLFNQKDLISKKKVLIVLITVIGLAQLAYSGGNYWLFKNAYIDMAYTSKNFIEKIVEKNLDSVYAKGLSLQNIEGFEDYLDSINNSLPQIEKISLVQEYNPENTGIYSQINAAIAHDYIDKQMFKILLDMLTVLVISIFFMIELTLLAVIIMIRGSKKLSGQPSAINYKTSHGLVRGLTFFISLCTYMSLTFVPIVMNNLYQHMGVLPIDVVLGLPLSAEMLGGILAIILAGWSINKKGWRSIFYIGALFLMAGNLISGLSFSALIYVLSRGIAGLGLGLILMAIRSLVVSLPENNMAIAQFSAGSIAGLNCGVVIGGMLADRVGYETVFYLTAILAIIPLLFVKQLMSKFEIETRETSDIKAWSKFVNFIADKRAILFLLCIFIPFFISGAFLDYYFPLFASSNDLSQSDISRGFLLNGLFIIYLGPFLTRYVTERFGNTKGLIAAMFIVASALLTFVFFGSVAAAFMTLILLGIAESFAISLKTTHFLNLKGIKDLQINEGIAYFSGMVNLSRMAGPIVYGLALSLGMRLGVGLISLGILVLLIVFIFSNKFQRTYSNISET